MAVDILRASRADHTRHVEQVFGSFRAELDEHHDRRELLVKTSRDITALSKKIIFALHRITIRSPNAVFAEAELKLRDVLALFQTAGPFVEGDTFYRYQRAISPGIEEFIEAVSFLHFLRHRTLISLVEVQSILSSPDSGALVVVTPEDYLLGLSDLTGELMRYAINSIGAGNPAVATEVGQFLRVVKAEFDPLVPSVRNLGKKMGTMAASLRKIEDASYALTVRGAEYGDSPDRLLDYVRRLTASEEARGRDDEE